MNNNEFSQFAVVTRGLCKKYGNQLVLDNVSLRIPKGSIYGFVGLNGAGKTTVFRILSGLAKASAGYYEFNLSDGEHLRRTEKMSVIVEAPSLYQNLNGFENIRMQSKIAPENGKELSDDQIIELLKLVELPWHPKEKKKVKNYSLGMRQRLAIAQSLVGNPDLLILDEPSNGLDPEGILALRELLIRLNHEKGLTIIVSSHILAELAKLATHFGFIHHGRLLREVSLTQMENEKNGSTYTLDTTMNVWKVFDEAGIKNYQIIDHRDLIIRDDVDCLEVIKLLRENRYVVDSYSRNISLEKYFLNIVGGKTC